MFSFFSKKNYLIDYLEGFVDIHNHILPGIDDGAKTVEESISLLKGFGEFGVTDFICTPHIMENYYPNNAITINKSLKALNEKLNQEGLESIKIRAAAEHMIDSNFENILSKNEVMPIDKNYILIEMSYLQASINFDDAIKKIKEHNYFPILAHPERYVYLHVNTEKYQEYKNKDILFQLNLLSLSDYYGKDVQKVAFKLLDEGLIDFVSTDIHNIRQIEFLKTLTLNKKNSEALKPLIEKTSYNFSV